MNLDQNQETNKPLKISIVMATFNGAEFLSQQLESFRLQDRLPDELVICDDGSTDDTLCLLAAFKESVPFAVNIIVNEHNLGYTKNFEKALSHCTGDLIFLSDQDDIWFSSKIAIMEQVFITNPDLLLAIHDGELVDSHLISQGATKRSQVVSGYGTDDSFITGALTVLHRAFLPYALPIPDGILGHDGWLHSIAKLLGKRLVIETTLQILRRHSSNTSVWVASSLKPINKLDVAKSQFETTPALSYQDRILYNQNLIDRMRSIANLPNHKFSEAMIGLALNNLQVERSAIIKREKLLNLGFWGRKSLAISMFVGGDYVHFNGFKSFLRDVFR